MTNYGAKIAELRAAKRMTQAELGAMLNVTSQAVSKWEKGLSEPDMESITKICQIFDISYDEFFGAQPKQDDADFDEEESVAEAEAQPAEQKSAVVLAYCDVCDKPLYNPKDYQVSIENGIQHTTCLQCIPKKEEAKRQERDRRLAVERSIRQDDERHELKKGLLWGIAGAAGLAALAFFFTYFAEESTLVVALWSVFGAFGGYAIVSQCIWGNSVMSVFSFFLRSFKLPMFIFTLSLEGIIALIVVKILGAIICAILSVLLFLIGLIVTGAYAIVIFPFALIKELHDIKSMH